MARMMRKFIRIEENLLLASSTLLDPRLKKLAFSDAGAANRVASSISSEAAIAIQSQPFGHTNTYRCDATAAVSRRQSRHDGHSPGGGGRAGVSQRLGA